MLALALTLATVAPLKRWDQPMSGHCTRRCAPLLSV